MRAALLIASLAVAGLASSSAGSPPEDEPRKMFVHTSGRSTFSGMAVLADLKIRGDFGELVIPPSKIKTILLDNSQGTRDGVYPYAITTWKGSKIVGLVEKHDLKIDTELGTLSIPFENLTRVDFADPTKPDEDPAITFK